MFPVRPWSRVPPERARCGDARRRRWVRGRTTPTRTREQTERLDVRANPTEWDRRLQGREMLQYGTYTHSNRVYDKDEVDVETMPKILKDRVVQRLVERGVFDEDAFLPDSCTINVYRKGQWLPPHVDNPHFKRPFCTVSLVADETCIFGKGIAWHPGLDESRSTSERRKEENWQDVTETFEGEACRVVCEKNSALVLDGESGDVYEHAVLPVRAEVGRISLTFRKRDWDEDAVKRRTIETDKWRAQYRGEKGRRRTRRRRKRW